MFTLKPAEVTQNEAIKIKGPIFDLKHYSTDTAYYYDQNETEVKKEVINRIN
jgi:hypothetical protein